MYKNILDLFNTLSVEADSISALLSLRADMTAPCHPWHRGTSPSLDVGIRPYHMLINTHYANYTIQYGHLHPRKFCVDHKKSALICVHSFSRSPVLFTTLPLAQADRIGVSSQALYRG